MTPCVVATVGRRTGPSPLFAMSPFNIDPALLITGGLVLAAVGIALLVVALRRAARLRAACWETRLRRSLWGQRLRDSGVGLNAYVDARGPETVRQEIYRCRACTLQQRCAQALMAGEPAASFDRICVHQERFERTALRQDFEG